MTGRLMMAALALAVTGCATTSSFVNCKNAATVRQAAAATVQAIDLACPMPDAVTPFEPKMTPLPAE
ncbi:MAG: hypothetical protein ACOYLS_01250 [Polymorphobacter sp.]